VGQLMDVFIEAAPSAGIGVETPAAEEAK